MYDDDDDDAVVNAKLFGQRPTPIKLQRAASHGRKSPRGRKSPGSRTLKSPVSSKMKSKRSSPGSELMRLNMPASPLALSQHLSPKLPATSSLGPTMLAGEPGNTSDNGSNNDNSKSQERSTADSAAAASAGTAAASTAKDEVLNSGSAWTATSLDGKPLLGANASVSMRNGSVKKMALVGDDGDDDEDDDDSDSDEDDSDGPFTSDLANLITSYLYPPPPPPTTKNLLMH
eukprot:TRINITY_DN67512_c3_g15_i1.p1 TRINITY_DN67512_c3_g15~~TRINITY_DN67512_c3_g15_i1.p1  ORF type:complete len:231 (-),score=108.22 TRINITY_DN67512_c3_g15_i1:48-740(-)